MSNRKHVECIKKQREAIKSADPSVGWVRFKCAGDNGITGQYIEYSQTVKKRDGSEKVVEKKSFITHDYCPFCGEKYT